MVNHYFFFFNDTATTEIYTLSLHDALPILRLVVLRDVLVGLLDESALVRLLRVMLVPDRVEVPRVVELGHVDGQRRPAGARSEEHTSELQSRQYLVCRLLLEKKNNVCRFFL